MSAEPSQGMYGGQQGNVTYSGNPNGVPYEDYVKISLNGFYSKPFPLDWYNTHLPT